ncbi:uncharacterized protein [Nicotiana tomentosiformis]|uniref:uncharacterized protein n=1 Tax=Nicotiana tomentosiformis TaxID=4098 RepID=UPI00388C38D7
MEKGEVPKVGAEKSKRVESYMQIARLEDWPKDNVKKCLLGSFRCPMQYSLNYSDLKQWASLTWKIPAGVIVKEVNSEYFSFEFPSRTEAERIKMGKWMYNGAEIHLEWWSLVSVCYQKNYKPNHIWIKLMGFPSNIWSESIFKTIGDRFGGFVDVDEDTKTRRHLRWARICVNFSGIEIPATIEMEVDGMVFRVPLWVETWSWVEESDRNVMDPRRNVIELHRNDERRRSAAQLTKNPHEGSKETQQVPKGQFNTTRQREIKGAAIQRKEYNVERAEDMAELNHAGEDVERFISGSTCNWLNPVEADPEGNLHEVDIYNSMEENMNSIQGWYSDNDLEEVPVELHLQIDSEEEMAFEPAPEFLMLPWYEGENFSMQERLNQLEISAWVERNMIKISKQLGVKSIETEERLLDLLLRIEDGRPKKSVSSSEHRNPSPGKKYERGRKLLEFGVKYTGESSSSGFDGGRGKGRRAMSGLNQNDIAQVRGGVGFRWTELEAQGNSGGIIVYWDKRRWNCKEKYVGQHSLTTLMEEENTCSQVTFTGVYAPYEEEKKGNARNTRAMRDFSRIINVLSLLDPPLHGECGDGNTGKGYFKFEDMWFEHKYSIELVEKWWNSYRVQGKTDEVLAKKLKLLKEDMKKWNKEVFGNLEDRKTRALSKMEVLDQGGLLSQNSGQMEAERCAILSELEAIAKAKEISWRQKSRCLWIEHGDRNTKFFHKQANTHKRYNSIDKIVIEGELSEDDELIKKHIVGFYNSLFRESEPWRPEWSGNN